MLVADTDASKQAALDAYWAAQTPQACRAAVDRLKALGEWKDYGEQCADTDGMAHDVAARDYIHRGRITELETRNAVLEAKLEATMLDLQATARSREEYKAEAERLSAVAQELAAELKRRMAIPARALRFGASR